MDLEKAKLDREELERDIVTRDKQTVITMCLNLFDINTDLIAKFEELDKRYKGQKELIASLEGQLTLLESNKRKRFKVFTRKF